MPDSRVGGAKASTGGPEADYLVDVEVEWAPANDPAANQAWREVLRPLALELRDAAPQFATELASVYARELPHVFPDEASVEQNRVSTEATALVLAQVIERGGDPRRVELPDATVAIARSAVWRQLPLADLLRTYRLGHELVWRWMFDRIAAVATDPALLLTAEHLASGWLFAYVDAAVTRAATVYDEERENWMRGAMAARGEAIEAVLAREETDPARASARLRHDVRRQHLGVVAWLDAPPVEGDTQTVLARVVNELAGRLGVQQPLVFPSGMLTCSAWLSRSAPFADEDIAELARTSLHQASVALGEPGSGLDGFRRTHREADQARRISVLHPTPVRLRRYADVALLALSTRDEEMAVDFVTRVLGPLAAPDENVRRLVETLAVFLEENRSRKRAAARLHIHPNTVNYRVRQAEELLGVTVDTASLDLRAALALLPVLPAPAPSI